MSTGRARQRRKGNVLVLTAFMMIAMFAMVACAVDLGYLQVARAELQRSADAAALAATWELIDDDALRGYSYPWYLAQNARIRAAQYAALNEVTREGPGLTGDDVLVGYLPNLLDPAETLRLDGARPANAVQVRVRKTADQNGEVPLFFARALGFDGSARQAQATAVLMNSFIGFRPPSTGENLGLLPFALDLETWQNMLAGIGTDDWTWNDDLGQVTSGQDGILEVNLFPQDTGAPGNRGTVDIGSDNNSTADIARQILYGVTEADLAHHGGRLELDENGQLILNGDTGISAGVKDELASIIGKPRIIVLFSEVSGPGDNAMYTIVAFCGIRILEVKLTGKGTSKRVMIQAANVLTLGGIPATDGRPGHFVYSPVWLVR